MLGLDRLPARDNEGRLLAVIESPQGSRNKLKYDPKLGSFKVSQSLPVGMSFPFDFGFIPGTRGEDGDPMDVLILMDAPAYPGCVVPITLLGVIEAEQRDNGESAVRNDRLIAIAEGATERGTPGSLKDLDDQLLDQIEAFFANYNRLRGSVFKPLGRRGVATATRLLEHARSA